MRIDNPIPIEEFLYLVETNDKDKDGNPHFEISQFRKEKFWFFGWDKPENLENFVSWKELIVGIKE